MTKMFLNRVFFLFKTVWLEKEHLTAKPFKEINARALEILKEKQRTSEGEKPTEMRGKGKSGVKIETSRDRGALLTGFRFQRH